jgi:Undecaprenyl-phosphate glucose phosphotransferase
MTFAAGSSYFSPHSPDNSAAAKTTTFDLGNGLGAGWQHKKTHAREARAVLVAVIRLMDFSIVLMTGVAAYAMRHQDVELPVDVWLVAGLGALLGSNLFSVSRIYDFSNVVAQRRQMARVLAGWCITILILIPVVLQVKPSLDNTLDWLVVWAASCGIALVLIRTGLRMWMKRGDVGNATVLRVVVLGTDSSAHDVAARLRRSGGPQTKVEVLFPGDGMRETEDQCLNHLIELTRIGRIDEVVIPWPFDPVPYQEFVLSKLGHIPIDVKLHINTPQISLAGGPESPSPLPVLLIHTRPLAGWCSILKRSIDVIFSVGLLAAFSPLMLVIAFAIAVDSRGPLLFRQLRFGLNGEPIVVYKFRTMYHGAGHSATVTQASRDDPRVTRVGAFLRRRSLDELPQLYNVCRGQMSLVGPRPHAIAHNEIYARVIKAYSARHLVKPGITGWAQVNGARGATPTSQAMQKRVEYDLYYIGNWSLMLDIRILCRTIWCMFHDPNAY